MTICRKTDTCEMYMYIVVNQTISKRWAVPEGKAPQAFLAEVLEYGFGEEPENGDVRGVLPHGRGRKA